MQSTGIGMAHGKLCNVLHHRTHPLTDAQGLQAFEPEALRRVRCWAALDHPRRPERPGGVAHGWSQKSKSKGGVFIFGFFFLVFFLLFSSDFFLPLLASWLLGFLASWLLGFLASWLLGFLASWLLGFLASWLFGLLACRLLFLACWLLGFLASWLLGFSASWLLGFWASGLLGFLASWLLGFLASILCRVIAPLFESTLLQTSWGGGAASPPLLFRFLAEIELHPCLNHHFFEAAKYDILVICVIHVCLYVCVSSNIIGEATPANPPAAF